MRNFNCYVVVGLRCWVVGSLNLIGKVVSSWVIGLLGQLYFQVFNLLIKLCQVGILSYWLFMS